MIGVEGQYVFRFSIGDSNDFIDDTSLEYFTVVEESGNALPTWQIAFTTTDPELPGVFHEGNDFEVSFGSTINDLEDIKLLITKRTLSHIGEQIYRIESTGIYSAMAYITQPNISISDKKSGVEIIKSTAGKHFRIDANVDASQDSQNWIQPNITDKAFVDQLWLHSYLVNSFLATAITFNGKFRIRDIKKQASEEHVFKFTQRVEEEKKDISYSGDNYIEAETGFINCWVGYGREKLVHKLEADTHNKHLEEIKPLLALTTKLNRRADIGKRSTLIGVHNENTHSKYWQAALRNISGLAIFSSEKNTLSFESKIINIHPLDVVMFKDEELDEKGYAAEFHSGLYIVGAVGRSISSKIFTTTIDLYRESFNALKGELR